MENQPCAYCIYYDKKRILVFYFGILQNKGFTLEDYLNKKKFYISKRCETIFFDSSFKKYFPESCSGWFKDFEVLTQIFGLENLNTKYVSDYSNMFNGCLNIMTIDLSKLHPRESINVNSMFKGCENLSSVKGVKKFLTSDSMIPSSCEKSRYLSKRESIERVKAACPL